MSQDNSVRNLDTWFNVRVLISHNDRDIFIRHHVLTDTENHSAAYTVSTETYFLLLKTTGLWSLC